MRSQLGMSLLEVLLAMVIINIGLLGVMELSRDYLHQLRNNFWRAQALIRIAALAERLRANDSIAADAAEFKFWQGRNQKVLPRSHSELRCNRHHCHLRLDFAREREIKWTIYR